MKNALKSGASLLLVVLLSIGLGAAWFGGNPDTSELDETQDTSGVDLGTSWIWESKLTEQNQQDLAKAQPPLDMDDSLERQNLRQRYKHLNDRDVVHHVYLFSYGKLIGYYTAQGKVSSVNSKLTQPEQKVPCDRSDHGNNECIVSSPQMDGSYGTNGDGIFFFTTDDRYVEWNGEYLVSDQPLNQHTPATVVKQLDSTSKE